MSTDARALAVQTALKMLGNGPTANEKIIAAAIVDALAPVLRERDEARAQFDAHDELLHQCLNDRDAYRQRAIKGEAERDEATHTLDFVEKHLTARLEAAEADAALHIECNQNQYARLGKFRAALETAREALASSYNVLTYPGDGTSKQDKAIAAIDATLDVSSTREVKS